MSLKKLIDWNISLQQSTLGSFENHLISSFSASLRATPGTVSRIYVSSRKPSRDSTPVTRTAGWASWKTCCRTQWYLSFMVTLNILLSSSEQKAAGAEVLTHRCHPDCCARPRAAAARGMTEWSNPLERAFAESSPLWHICESAITAHTFHTHTHRVTHTSDFKQMAELVWATLHGPEQWAYPLKMEVCSCVTQSCFFKVSIITV